MITHVRTMIDTSPEAGINPDNAPWKPGYRFGVTQYSLKRTGSMSRRGYFCGFKIDADGKLVWRSGVKARPETIERVQALYDRERGK